MNVQEFYPIFLKYPKICTDSRKVSENSVFFALKGEAFDGNRFAEAALQNGCRYAVIDDPQFRDLAGAILVDDALGFLQELARFHRQQFSIPVIALTGSNGKTTTKELMAAVLSKNYSVVFTEGNLNNHIGVPLTVLKLQKDTDLLIVEMGANHLGEIAALCRIAQPTHGLITNIGEAHLEGFGSLEGVVKAKSELYQFIMANQGTLLVNQSDPLLTGLVGDYSCQWYGSGAHNYPKVTLNPGFYLSFNLDLRPVGVERELAVTTNLVGEYNLANALAAISVGRLFDTDWEQAAEAVAAYRPGNNRSELRKTVSNTVIMDAYNANPASMKAALRGFAALKADDKVAILGEMREMGTFSEEVHREIVQLATIEELEMILVGNEFKKIAANQSILWFDTADHLIDHLHQNPLKGKTILLKGSRANYLEKVLPYL